MKRHIIVTLIVLFFSSILTVYAGGPDFDGVNVGSPTIDCSGRVSVSATLDWNYASSANWQLSVDGTPINSGVVNRVNDIDTFEATGIITPRNDPSVAVGLRIQSFGGVGYDQTFTQFTSAEVCESGANPPPAATCDDGRLNPDCDVVAIYVIRDTEGVHMQVWYVLPEGGNGRFAFMLYENELDALPDHPEEAVLVAASTDNYVRLYWLSDSSFQINAGPDGEGKQRIFNFASFPGTVRASTLEPQGE
jgi:hypothetical protein